MNKLGKTAENVTLEGEFFVPSMIFVCADVGVVRLSFSRRIRPSVDHTLRTRMLEATKQRSNDNQRNNACKGQVVGLKRTVQARGATRNRRMPADLKDH